MVMTIGEVARRTGLTTAAVRYYEKVGLLPRAPRGPNRYRQYGADVIDRINFIRLCQEIGFTLREIHQVLILHDKGTEPCRVVVNQIRSKSSELARRIKQLQARRADFRRLLASASRPREQEGTCVCYILESRAPARGLPKVRSENGRAFRPDDPGHAQRGARPSTQGS
jgi:DNA-binding transcriptional MerR regulator